MSKLHQETLDLVYSAMKAEESRVNTYYQMHYDREDFAMIPESVREKQEASYHTLKEILGDHNYVGTGAAHAEGKTARELLNEALVFETGGSYRSALDENFNISAGQDYTGLLQVALNSLVKETPKPTSVAPAFSI